MTVFYLTEALSKCIQQSLWFLNTYLSLSWLESLMHWFTGTPLNGRKGGLVAAAVKVESLEKEPANHNRPESSTTGLGILDILSSSL